VLRTSILLEKLIRGAAHYEPPHGVPMLASTYIIFKYVIGGLIFGLPLLSSESAHKCFNCQRLLT
jgi:hypothetical protein